MAAGTQQVRRKEQLFRSSRVQSGQNYLSVILLHGRTVVTGGGGVEGQETPRTRSLPLCVPLSSPVILGDSNGTHPTGPCSDERAHTRVESAWHGTAS